MSKPSQICSQCGAALPGGADRCSYCGSPVRPVRAESARRDQSLPAAGPESARKVESSPPAGEKRQLPPQFVGLKRPLVKPYVAGSGCLLIFGLFWTLFSALFVFLGIGIYVRDTIEYNRLSTEGLPATAVVTDLKVESDDDSDSYYVYYEFRVPVQGDTIRFQDSDEISEDYYRQLSVGQKIPVIYWASDPDLSAVKAEFRSPGIFMPVVLSGTGGLFVLIGLAMLWGALKNIRQSDRLRLHGRPAQAFLFDRWTGTDSDGDPTYLVAYAFEVDLPDGRRTIITGAEQNRKAYDRYQVGDPVPVRYLPDDPNICRLEIERKGFSQ